MRDYVSMSSLVTTKLQSAGTADFSVAEVDYGLEEGLKEFATLRPHIHPVIFKIESRSGHATATSTDNLVDTDKGQFLAADATDEKVVHNVTDNTYAVVLSQASTAQIGLSRDIFVSGEEYRIYNKRCGNKRQVYIGDMPDWLQIDSVEYPMGTRRDWKIYNDVLEIDAGSIADSDANTALIQKLPNVDVLVRFARPHILSQLTDWVGKFAATAAAGATTLSASSLQSAGTIEEGEEFYIENHRTLYVVSQSITIASNTAAIVFYPGLESAVSSTSWTFTFTKSTLKPNQEEVFADLVAGRVAINKAPLLIKENLATITTLTLANTALTNMANQIASATTYVAAGSTEAIKSVAIILAAATALNSIDASVALASSSLASGTAYHNTINIGGDVAGSFARYATERVNIGRGYLEEAQGYFTQARADEELANTYGGLAIRATANATAYFNQGIGYLRRLSSELAIGQSWKAYQEWGERKVSEAISKLKSSIPPKTKRRYPID